MPIGFCYICLRLSTISIHPIMQMNASFSFWKFNLKDQGSWTQPSDSRSALHATEQEGLVLFCVCYLMLQVPFATYS